MSPQDEEKLTPAVPAAGQIPPQAAVSAPAAAADDDDDDDEYEYVEVDADEVGPDEDEYEYVEVDAAEPEAADADDDEYEYEYEYMEVDADDAEADDDDDDDEYEYVEVDADEVGDDDEEYEYVEVDADEAEAESEAEAEAAPAGSNAAGDKNTATPAEAAFDPAAAKDAVEPGAQLPPAESAPAATAAAAAGAAAGAAANAKPAGQADAARAGGQCSTDGKDCKPCKVKAFLRSLIFEEPKKDGKSDAEKTPEELKKEKNDRIRRNLRILALAVACYYFVSAGYSWWEESKVENNPDTVAEQVLPINNPPLFREHFNASINALRSSLPTANANDSTSGFIAVLSPAIELRGVLNEADGSVQYVQLQTRYPDALPPESLTALRAFVCACEDNSDPEYADQILKALGIEPQEDANEAGKVFAETQVQSDKVRYELSFSDDAIDELTLRARAR